MAGNAGYGHAGHREALMSERALILCGLVGIPASWNAALGAWDSMQGADAPCSKSRDPVQGGLMGAHENDNLQRMCLPVRRGVEVRRWFSRGWRVERLDSGHSTFNCEAKSARVP